MNQWAEQQLSKFHPTNYVCEYFHSGNKPIIYIDSHVEMKAVSVIALTTAVLRIFEGHVMSFQPILRRKGIDECIVYQMLASVHYICLL